MTMNGLIGRKLGMTRVYGDDGRVHPVTVIEAGPCPVVHVRESAGVPKAVQLGLEAKKAKNTSRAEIGHARAGGLESAPRVLRELPLDAGSAAPNAGEMVTVEIFSPGDRVKVTGTTKGRGFQGVVKRYGFSGGPASHGSTRYRKPGSMGPGTDPSRVLKGKKLPGQYGTARHTETGLTIVKVDPKEHLLFVRGAVPGPMQGIVLVRRQGVRSRYA